MTTSTSTTIEDNYIYIETIYGTVKTTNRSRGYGGDEYGKFFTPGQIGGDFRRGKRMKRFTTIETEYDVEVEKVAFWAGDEYVSFDKETVTPRSVEKDVRIMVTNEPPPTSEEE